MTLRFKVWACRRNGHGQACETWIVPVICKACGSGMEMIEEVETVVTFG